MKTCLVHFSDDTYGIKFYKKGYGYVYQDFQSRMLSWPKNHQYFKDCKTTKEEAEKIFEAMSMSRCSRLHDKDTVVKTCGGYCQ